MATHGECFRVFSYHFSRGSPSWSFATRSSVQDAVKADTTSFDWNVSGSISALRMVDCVCMSGPSERGDAAAAHFPGDHTWHRVRVEVCPPHPAFSALSFHGSLGVVLKQFLRHAQCQAPPKNSVCVRVQRCTKQTQAKKLCLGQPYHSGTSHRNQRQNLFY